MKDLQTMEAHLTITDQIMYKQIMVEDATNFMLVTLHGYAGFYLFLVEMNYMSLKRVILFAS